VYLSTLPPIVHAGWRVMARRKVPARPGQVAPDARKVVALVDQPEQADAPQAMMMATDEPDPSDLSARVLALEKAVKEMHDFLVMHKDYPS
jgi:hypothetical protein